MYNWDKNAKSFKKSILLIIMVYNQPLYIIILILHATALPQFLSLFNI